MAECHSKLNDALIAQADKLIRAGNYEETVYKYLGIHKTTWYEWKKRAEKYKVEETENVYTRFLDMVEKATAAAEIGAISGILTAAKDGNWQAYAWYLERKNFRKWGRKELLKQEITGEDGQPIAVPIINVNFLRPKENREDD